MVEKERQELSSKTKKSSTETESHHMSDAKTRHPHHQPFSSLLKGTDLILSSYYDNLFLPPPKKSLHLSPSRDSSFQADRIVLAAASRTPCKICRLKTKIGAWSGGNSPSLEPSWVKGCSGLYVPWRGDCVT